jgi:hypothetical protein
MRHEAFFLSLKNRSLRAMAYVPKLDQISKEVISYGIALVFVAFLIAKSPKLKKLIKEYEF